jgi:hypothetical protein
MLPQTITSFSPVVLSQEFRSMPVLMLVFWVITPRGLVGRYQRLGATHYRQLQGVYRIKAGK